MKKIIACMLVALFTAATMVPAHAAKSKEPRGGVAGFFVGCCFGIRAAADFNDGKNLHWRDWTPIVPYVGIIFNVWNGVDGASGTTTKDLSELYGSRFY